MYLVVSTEIAIVKARKAILLASGINTVFLVLLLSNWGTSVMGLPPKEDIPEEILRTEIIIIGRSPVDGKELNAAEYAELLSQLQVSPPRKLDPKIREQVFLLRIRKALLQIFPFLNL